MSAIYSKADAFNCLRCDAHATKPTARVPSLIFLFLKHFQIAFNFTWSNLRMTCALRK